MRNSRRLRIVVLLSMMFLGVMFTAGYCRCTADGTCVWVDDGGAAVFCIYLRGNSSSADVLCISSGGGGGTPPTPTATPIPPRTPIAGFSSGSWGGAPPSDSNYSFGILDASTGSGWCTYPGSLNPYFVNGSTALGASKRSAFWFLTSLAYARTTCGFTNTTAVAWGQQQASYFVQAVSAVQPGGFDIYFADIETLGGYAKWLDCQLPPSCDLGSNYSHNQDVIRGFFTYLCGNGYCFNGVYTSTSNWQEIIGPVGVAPYLGTSQVWIASFGPSQAQLNLQQQYFTTSPGGYSVYSWQYTDESCFLTFAAARAEANNAVPFIPRFDKWTNAQPNLLC